MLLSVHWAKDHKIWEYTPDSQNSQTVVGTQLSTEDSRCNFILHVLLHTECANWAKEQKTIESLHLIHKNVQTVFGI